MELAENYEFICFFNGLKDEIRLPIRMLKPHTLNSAFGLAKFKEYINSSKRNGKPTPTNQFNTPSLGSWTSGGKGSGLSPGAIRQAISASKDSRLRVLSLCRRSVQTR